MNLVTVKIKMEDRRMMPVKAHASDACFDLTSSEEVTVFPGKAEVVNLGFSLEIPVGWEAQIRPRSGLSSKLKWAAFGTIDADYRGPVKTTIANFSDTPFTINIGDRIAQMAFSPVPQVSLMEVDSLSPSPRGAGGFGSTGVQALAPGNLNSGTDA